MRRRPLTTWLYQSEPSNPTFFFSEEKKEAENAEGAPIASEIKQKLKNIAKEAKRAKDYYYTSTYRESNLFFFLLAT